MREDERRRLEERLAILEAYVRAVEDPRGLLDLLEGAADDDAARARLSSLWEISDLQARAVLSLQLHRFAAEARRESVRAERDELVTELSRTDDDNAEELTESEDWESRVAAFWAAADEEQGERMRAELRALIDERPEGDAAALFEWASLHDFLGVETEAIPLYEAALSAGLDAGREPQAVIQLASSLRVVGRASEAVALLRAAPESPVVGASREGLLALALHDAGATVEALRVAVDALAAQVPRYGRALRYYAAELGAGPEDRAPDGSSAG